MAPYLRGEQQPTTPSSLANVIEDGTNISFYESELLINYTGEGTLRITSLSADYGSVTPTENGGKRLWTFTPKANYNGTVNLAYVITDDSNESINGFNSFEITAINDAPELTGTQVSLAGGSDLETFTLIESDLLQGFTDIDGDDLKVENLFATHGDLKNNRDGTWSFTPTLNHSGTVDLNYGVSDNKGGIYPAKNSFNVAPLSIGPRLTGTIATLPGGREGTPYLIKTADLLKGFTDTNGNLLAISDLKANAGTLVDNNNGSWTLTGDKGSAGIVTLTYKVGDGQGNFQSAINSFPLIEVNDAPVLTGKKNNFADGIENSSITLYTIDLLRGYSDPEGDNLSISNINSNNASLTKFMNRGWTLVPDQDYIGDITLNYQINDGEGNSVNASNTLTIKAPNRAPIQSGNKANLMLSGSSALARTTSNRQYLIETDDLLKGYSDPDGDVLSIEGLSASPGKLKKNADNTWSLTTDSEANEMVQLSYDIVDRKGGSTFVSNIIFLDNNRQTNQRGTSTESRVIEAAEPKQTISSTPKSTKLKQRKQSRTLEGNQKNNTIRGSKKDDAIIGHQGKDKLIGRGGDDVLDGGLGRDKLQGGSGDDELIGGVGKDKLWGQSGQDRFLLSRGRGYDIIADFESRNDLIQLPASVSDVQIQSRRGDALIYDDNDLLARIKGAADTLSMNGNMVM